MTIKDVLQSVPMEQQRQLMYALDNGMSYMIKMPDGKILGVYISGVKGISVIEKAGVWVYGETTSHT